MNRIQTINIHAGHTKAAGKAPGASGLLNESAEARKVVKEITRLLKSDGITVYDCTANGSDESDNLARIVKKCNAHKVDLDVSIHFNSGRNDEKGDGKTGGVEALIYSTGGIKEKIAKSICKRVANLGFENRGVKVRENLYFLRNTMAPAILVECCFVDDKDDAALYQADAMAKKIANGIAGHVIYEKPTGKVNKTSKKTDVKWLQQHLNACIKAREFKKLRVNGQWSAALTEAMLLYKKQLGWNRDGKSKGTAAGPKTIRALSGYREK